MKQIDEQQVAVEAATAGFWAKSMQSTDSRLAWWRDARFGMFIHWGVYSIAGGLWKDCPPVGYGEHLMRACRIPKSEYVEELVKPFEARDFDADAWAEAALQAGMKYMIITTKHHDGFAMFPSEAYPYDIRMTQCKVDPIAQLKEACTKRGLKFGCYYSHAFDWEHPDAPGNDWEHDNPGGDKNLHANPGELWHTTHPERIAKAARYVDEKAIPQILELIHNYHPDILWFDTPHKLPTSENLRILKAIREADENIIVNSRVINYADKDYREFADYLNTADRPAELYPTIGDWEAIPTTNESYGYSKFDHSHKPASHFVRLLAKIAARGGNMLMNIGPKGDGTFDVPDAAILRGIGEWLKQNGESIYATRRSPLFSQVWGETTLRGNTLYLHIFDVPENRKLILGGLGNTIKNAHMLVDGREVPVRRLNYYDHEFLLPEGEFDAADTVVKVEFNGEIVAKPDFLMPLDRPFHLRSFDAVISAGLHYGDGKTNRDYVFHWKDTTQFVTWNIRLPRAMQLKIDVSYLALHTPGVTGTADMTKMHDCGGTYLLYAGKEIFHAPVRMSADVNTPTVDSYTVSLPAGESTLQVRAEEVTGLELMKLLGLLITPLDSAEIQSEIEVDVTDTGN